MSRLLCTALLVTVAGTAVVPAPQSLKHLTREASVSEVFTADRVILRGPLKPATTDGSAYYHVGDHVLTLHDDCALRPTLEALLHGEVRIIIERWRPERR